MQIILEINGSEFSATLKTDSAAAKDFYAMLPLSLTLTDYASIEKVADLPSALSTQGEPAGTSACAGDITYYAPWGNLAIFSASFGRASGLIKLGQLDEGVDIMKKKGPLPVVIRHA